MAVGRGWVALGLEISLPRYRIPRSGEIRSAEIVDRALAIWLSVCRQCYSVQAW